MKKVVTGNLNMNESEKYYGFYRGIVQYNIDDMKLGRIKVRVPAVNMGDGIEKEKDFKGLPWAIPGIFFGAAYDMGNFIVPMVGTAVLVAFEAGDKNHPIYFGGLPSVGGKGSTMVELKDGKHPDFMSGAWTAPTDGDAPKDVYEQGRTNEQDITRNVIYKSSKGHTIYMDDTDGKESLTIVDRIGQMIKFYSPVSVAKNKGNAARRGIRRASSLDQLKEADGVGDAKIVIMSGDSLIKVTPDKIIIKSPVVSINPPGETKSYL